MDAKIVLSALGALVALGATVASQAQFQSGPQLSRLDQVAIEDLRVAYLTCDRMALQLALDPDTGERCALVSLTLVRRSFGGKVDELLKWREGARTSGFAAKQALAFKTLALAARDRDAAPRIQDQPIMAIRR